MGTCVKAEWLPTGATTTILPGQPADPGGAAVIEPQPAAERSPERAAREPAERRPDLVQAVEHTRRIEEAFASCIGILLRDNP